MTDCKKCFGKTKIVDSRPTKRGCTKRKRKCLECNYQFYTVEIDSATLSTFKTLASLGVL